MEPNTPEFFVRVKLPSSAGYPSCPSGDTDYDNDYKGAIFAAKPQGFEVRWPRLNEKWAVDSEGRTLVPLYLTDEKSGLIYFMDKCRRLEAEIKRIRETIKSI